MKLIRSLNEGAYKDRQEALAQARKDFHGFMEDFLHDGILDMLLSDPKDLTANAELKNGLTYLKKMNPKAYEILKEGMSKV